jgi:hypothetical protein
MGSGTEIIFTLPMDIVYASIYLSIYPSFSIALALALALV